MGESTFARGSIAALFLVTAVGGCSTETPVGTGTPAAAPVGARAQTRRPAEMSPMGARARHAVRAVAAQQAPAILFTRDDEGGGGDPDEEQGGPGPLEDGGELPGGNQGELAIAVDDSGDHIVVGFNDFRGFNNDPISVSGFMYSDDGGKTFTDGGQLPAPPTADLDGTLLPQVFGDPDVKYLGGCNFIYTSIIVAPFQAPGGPATAVQTMGFHRSRDCGHTWEGPFEITSASNPSGNLFMGLPFDAADKEFMDVDRKTGRVLMSWTNFTADPETFAGIAQISSTFSDNVLGDDPTWNPQVIVAARDVDGQGSVPRFDASGKNVYIAWHTGFSFYFSGVSFARSSDGGVTFGPPIDLVPDGFFDADQVLGNDRIHSFPTLAVDKSTGPNQGTIYVSYAQNDSQDGADVVVQRSTDGGKSFGGPTFITSRPGSDRSQWFPALAVNGKSGRAFVFYYDQGIADSGDLIQSTVTFSDDGGRSWAQPRPLSARPFHGGWGNDTSQPNLGDYNMGVVTSKGDFLAAFAVTHPVGFTDNQPISGSMTVPEPTVRDLAPSKQAAITSVDLRSATATEVRGLSDRNGFLDAGEVGLVSLAIRNYVTNPMNDRTIDGAFAVVQSTTPGARVLVGVTAFQRLRPGDTRTALVPIILQLDRSFVSGTDVTLAIRVFSVAGLPTDLEATLHTGTPVETVLVSENFETVPAGKTVPAGWTAAHGAGADGTIVPWTTTTTFCGTTSRAAFHVNANDGAAPDEDNARWERLIGPAFAVPADTEYVTVDLDVCTDTEEDPNFNVQAYDGLFLRVFDATAGHFARSVLVEAFEQGFTTDGFEGYPRHFPRNRNPSYFEDMSVWAGDSGGIHHVRLRLPGMAGTTAQLRFEFAQNALGTCADIRPGHTCGVLVDNVVVMAVKSRR